MKVKTQKGFTLLEVSIAVALTALGVLAALQLRTAQSQIDAARGVAQVYEKINNAAGSYMTLFYKQLIDEARNAPECAFPYYRVGGSSNIPFLPGRKTCSRVLKINEGKPNQKNVTVENFLQPTPENLREMGLLSEVRNNFLPLITHAIDNNVALTTYARNDGVAGVARNGFAILIEPICIGSNVVINSTDESNNCGLSSQSRTVDLRSLVYNLQPYLVNSPKEAILYQVTEAAGVGNTYVSDTRTGKFLGVGGVEDLSLKNPLVYNSNSVGAPFVLAMRNGYSSAGKDVFVRKDGTTPLTGEWFVDNNSITGVKTLGANTVSAATVLGSTISGASIIGNSIWGNSINAGTVTATGTVIASGLIATGAVVGNTVTAAGAVTGGAGIFGGIVTSATAALKATTAYIQTALTVDGTITLRGDTTVEKFRLNRQAALGDACDSITETLARSTTDGVRVLVCDSTNRWRYPQKDYGDEIAALSAAVSIIKPPPPPPPPPTPPTPPTPGPSQALSSIPVTSTLDAFTDTKGYTVSVTKSASPGSLHSTTTTDGLRVPETWVLGQPEGDNSSARPAVSQTYTYTFGSQIKEAYIIFAGMEVYKNEGQTVRLYLDGLPYDLNKSKIMTAAENPIYAGQVGFFDINKSEYSLNNVGAIDDTRNNFGDLALYIKVPFTSLSLAYKKGPSAVSTRAGYPKFYFQVLNESTK